MLTASAVQKVRLIGDGGHHQRLTAGDYAACDAFAEPVDAAGDLLAAQTYALIDEDAPGLGIEQRYHAAADLHMQRQQLQCLVQQALQRLALAHGATQIGKQRQQGTAAFTEQTGEFGFVCFATGFGICWLPDRHSGWHHRLPP